MESGSGKADVLLPRSASLFEELTWPSRGLQVAPILPSLLNLNYLRESSAGLTAKLFHLQVALQTSVTSRASPGTTQMGQTSVCNLCTGLSLNKVLRFPRAQKGRVLSLFTGRVLSPFTGKQLPLESVPEGVTAGCFVQAPRGGPGDQRAPGKADGTQLTAERLKIRNSSRSLESKSRLDKGLL